MKVSELEGDQLDYLVAMAEGHKPFYTNPPATEYERAKGWHWKWLRRGDYGSAQETPRYSRDWAHGGPIIEREQITVLGDRLIEWDEQKQKHQANGFEAMYRPFCPVGEHTIEGEFTKEGRTYLIAAMRAYVARKYGETVPGEA